MKNPYRDYTEREHGDMTYFQAQVAIGNMVDDPAHSWADIVELVRFAARNRGAMKVYAALGLALDELAK